MASDRDQTCGKGLAAGAALPAKLGELVAARAEVLERHMKALNPAEPNGKRELDAYATLVRGHRDVAARLSALAHEMQSFRDLPMARHDMAVMNDPSWQMAAFRRFVEIERELVDYLTAGLNEQEEMLETPAAA